jgi:hypothetical protein
MFVVTPDKMIVAPHGGYAEGVDLAERRKSEKHFEERILYELTVLRATQ